MNFQQLKEIFYTTIKHAQTFQGKVKETASN